MTDQPQPAPQLTENQQIAHFAIRLVQNSTAPTDDTTQRNIAVVKGWLTAIAKGELIVGAPAVSPALEPPNGKKKK